MPDLDATKIRDFFRQGETATTRIGKGRALEDLICYVFGAIPGVTFYRRDALNVFDSEEIDVAFWNDQEPSGLHFLQNILLVECKNWSTPVGSSEVDWFLSKLRRRGQSLGFLIAASGITGDVASVGAAHEIIRSALAEKRQLIVITRAEIEGIPSTIQLVDLIKGKMCELAVSGTLFF